MVIYRMMSVAKFKRCSFLILDEVLAVSGSVHHTLTVETDSFLQKSYSLSYPSASLVVLSQLPLGALCAPYMSLFLSVRPRLSSFCTTLALKSMDSNTINTTITPKCIIASDSEHLSCEQTMHKMCIFS